MRKALELIPVVAILVGLYFGIIGHVELGFLIAIFGIVVGLDLRGRV